MDTKLDQLDEVDDVYYLIFNKLSYREILNLRINKTMFSKVAAYFNEDLNGKKLKLSASLLPAFFNQLTIAINQKQENENFLNIFKKLKQSITVDLFRDIIFHLNPQISTVIDFDEYEIFNFITVIITDNVDFPLEENIEVFLSNESASVELFIQYQTEVAACKISSIDIKYFSDQRAVNIRENGPGHIRILKGNIILEKYFKNNRLHRDGFPAYISCDKKCKEEKWYTNGELNKQELHYIASLPKQ